MAIIAKSIPSGRSHPERTLSRDWAPFAQNLASVLARLQEDQFLILSAKTGNRFVQFAAQGAWGMRVEVSSNAFLSVTEELSRHQISWLLVHGWNAPTGEPEGALPAEDPDGSPNFFIDYPTSTSSADIAQSAVETLVSALEFHHPAGMVYEAHGLHGEELAFPELKLKQLPRKDASPMEAVLATFRSATGMHDLDFDEDGDVTVYYGSIRICASLVGTKVRVCSDLATDIAESPALLRKLNEINDSAHRFRCVLCEDTIFSLFDVSADPFVAQHLVTGINEFAAVARDLAMALRAEFSGKAPVDSSGTLVYLH